jgi:prepilin-type N-terminal cleavage/methylation domain-containing protein
MTLHPSTPKSPLTPRSGFTLVEMMVVILIIGLLTAVSVTAVMRAMTTGRQTAIKLEVNALSQAVERYMQKYGDYPPDGSSRDVLERHMRRVFPRMTTPDTVLLEQLISPGGNFSYVAMDRAEALVFFLGGFSEDPLHPLIGEGGPLTLAPGVASPTTNLADYQYNATRDNAFFDFDLSRLTTRRANDTDPLLSYDEDVWTTPGERALAGALPGGVDQLPVYLTRAGEYTPYVYFDSRTYGLVGPGVYNGFRSPATGGVRPYKSELNIEAPRNGSAYADEVEAFKAVPFHNPSTFQIISPGLDGIFGTITENADGLPIHFVTQSGRAVAPTPANIFSPNIQRFQDGGSINGHLDNITNFSESTLENGLQ